MQKCFNYTRKKLKEKGQTKGITLVALVITIILLLILAGVAISMAVDSDGLFAKAREATEKWNTTVANEETQLNGLIDTLIPGVKLPGDAKLKVGDTVKWTPSGHYIWDKDVYSSDDEGTIKPYRSGSGMGTVYTIATKYLYSGASKEGKTIDAGWNTAGSNNLDFTIDTWKVLKVDETNKKVALVPASVTTPVPLKGATGYNNSVKLLNDACSALYGGNLTGVEVHNINMEDLEGTRVEGIEQEEYIGGLMASSAVVSAHASPYGTTKASAYSSANSKYPSIYAEEANRKITNSDSTTNNSVTGLELSEARSSFIPRGENGGAVKTAKGIQPVQTWYSLNNSSFTSALGTKSSLIKPDGINTYYWVSSRCVRVDPNYCYFFARAVFTGTLNSYDMLVSNGESRGAALGLFPIVTLSAGRFTATETAGEFEYTPAN